MKNEQKMYAVLLKNGFSYLSSTNILSIHKTKLEAEYEVFRLKKIDSKNKIENNYITIYDSKFYKIEEVTYLESDEKGTKDWKKFIKEKKEYIESKIESLKKDVECKDDEIFKLKTELNELE